MKSCLVLIFTLPLAPLAQQALPDAQIANAIKGPARAWENAPAEKKASWAAQLDALRKVDLPADQSPVEIASIQYTGKKAKPMSWNFTSEKK